MPRAKFVAPAKAGVQERWKNLDSDFRRNDKTFAFAFRFPPGRTERIRLS